ncbi:MAG: FkbM family methyltransferase [Thioploca sp.]|nr:FkbM family methyltransferase [Thioploca sp.]
MQFLAEFLSMIGRLYPLYSGTLKLANSKLFRLALNQQNGTVWTRLRCGAWIIVPIQDWIGRSLYYFGDLDPKITWICKKILRPGDTVIDIGANVGLVSIIARQFVGQTGLIHAFEPQVTLVDLMRQSLRKNSYSNIIAHPIALGTQEGFMELFVPINHVGAASLIQNKQHSHGNKVSIRIENATTYLTHLKLPLIRLVKIDVEGFEAKIIEGAAEFFKINQPDVILFELNDYSIPFFYQPVINRLSELGYQFFDIPKSKFKMRLYPLDLSSSKWYGSDILAVRKGEVYNDIAKLVGVV